MIISHKLKQLEELSDLIFLPDFDAIEGFWEEQTEKEQAEHE